MLFNDLKKLTSKRVNESGATVQLSAFKHQNKTVTLGIAGAQTIKLPKALGNGDKYRIEMPITATGSKVISVLDSVDAFQGGAINLPSANGAVTYFAAVAGTSDTITLNGTTSGGIRGSMLEFTSVDAGLWDVNVVTVSSGVAITPFSATI